MNFLEAAKEVISIESSPLAGTKDVVDFFSNYITQELDLRSTVLPSKTIGDSESNILLKLGEKVDNNKALLLLTHLDTTDPGSYGHWDKTLGNPFKLTIYGDDLYGLGVTNKLDYLCKLEALKSIKDQELRKPLYLLGTHSEESGLVGVTEFLNEFSDEIDCALVSHPTELNLYNEGLGIAVVEIEIPFSDGEKEFQRNHDLTDNTFTQSKVFRGKSAHSSMIDESESAIVKVFDFLDKMPSVAIMSVDGGILHNTVAEHALVEFVPSGSIKENISHKLLEVYKELLKLKEKFKKYPHSNFPSNFSTLNIGKIRSSKSGVIITVSCRILPSVPEREYRRWILNLKQSCSDLGAKFSFKNYTPSFSQDLDSKFVSGAYELAGLKSINNKKIKSSPICTEASLLQKHKIDCLLFGAGKGTGNSHQPNESISVSALKKSIEFYSDIIKRMCI